jgi:TRAP-type mannitol/chloroaromatic compound transport system substrate-binding protein
MKKSAGIMILSLVLILSLTSLSSVALADSKKVIKLNWQTYAMPTAEMFKTAKMVFEDLAKATDGRLIVKLHPGNSLVPDPQVFDAMSRGVIQGCIHTASYLGGKDMGFTLTVQPPPMLFTEAWQLPGWYYTAGGQQTVNKYYQKMGLKHLGMNFVSAECIMSKKSLARIEDFKGLKVRSLPGPTTLMFEKLGCSVLKIPGAEVYSALNTGIVDACEFVGPAEDYDAKLHEVTKFVQYPGIHSYTAARDVMVSLKAWNKLAPDLQAALQTAVNSYLAMDYLLAEPGQYKALKKMIDYGLEWQTLTPEDEAKARKMGLEVAQEMMAASPMSKEILESMLSYLKEIGVN